MINNNKLTPYWITGFSDGEASFHASISKNERYSLKYQIIPTFTIELKNCDIHLLYKIQEYFEGIGNISHIKNKGHSRYTVTKLQDLHEIIIPHFNKYPLLTIKRINFLLFKKIVDILHTKVHLNYKDIQPLLNIRASMNKRSINKNIKTLYNIVPVDLPILENLSALNITSDWLIGFTDAEGCFFVNIRNNRNNNGYWVTPVYCLTQHSRDTVLFNIIKNFFGGGFITTSEENVVRFRTENLNFIIEKIIPMFKNTLQSKKALDFNDFCEICMLLKKGAHLTNNGFEQIKIIKNRMNTKRTIYL